MNAKKMGRFLLDNTLEDLNEKLYTTLLLLLE